MKIKFLFFFFFLLLCEKSFSQEEEHLFISIGDTIPTVTDSLYREDQFYFGFSFNLLTNTSESISQSGFSGGVYLGAIRDFPLNERRNIALGIGLGWSLNSYGHNLFIGESQSGESIFRSLGDNISYDTNRFTTQLVEAPIEFRWRTSTATNYKFWRIYTGLRLGYVYHLKSNFVQEANRVVQTDVPEFDRFRLGATFTFGYNTFNFHFYYNLNSFFSDAYIQNEEVELSTLKMGLMFYIL
ncbi:porin family protein [Salegentibacter sp. F188]|uniref:Porin family protein n=1 Tax=Autumnicola patrickiae TaxID=3075591 RepID=A0ABU3E6Y4_9FLAO|nr:porin family protein [Salegentibacter sp. F188]MDT0691663.1 porin family protein [Salegentibacter sp. F188]